jgi:endonuclease YncB( thermonuclease family)
MRQLHTGMNARVHGFRRPRVAAVALAAGLILAGPPASGQEAASSCRYDLVGDGLVGSVTDGRTLVLEDGREVRLAGIEVPSVADSASDHPSARAAQAALAEIVAGKAVALQAAGRVGDRYGRVLAYVFAAGAARPVQHQLLARGHAQVGAGVGDRACAAELLASEGPARTAKLGLWADPYYDIRRAEKPAEVLAQRGRFAVVEGKVLSVRESGATIYVNFGRRWSQDFTVTIAKRNERAFAAAGVEPKALAGRQVRVRGWIEERGGPWIEAVRPAQIEVADRN